VHLALAAARGNARAVALLESQILSRLPLFLARLKQPAAFVEDVGQLLREHLLVGAGDGRPRLLEFSGKGSLANWVRVIALRTAIDLTRKRTEVLRDANQILQEASKTAGSDPELAFIRDRCRHHFEAALQAAVASLSSSERMLLKLHFHEGVTLDELAQLQGVHRTTVARRIAAARREIIARGRTQLRERLALSPSELESLMRLMADHLDLSLGGMLGSA
jgi:RNA polymerase sigma-70 factor, ECF subfamily